jgi:hypothetical protein
MIDGVVVWSGTGLIGLAFSGAFWWLSMGKHSLPDTDGLIREAGQPPRRFPTAVPLPALLERAVADGDVLYLAWPDEVVEPATGMVRWYVQDEFPTGVLPTIHTADAGVTRQGSMNVSGAPEDPEVR